MIDIIKKINEERQTVKKYSDKKISDETWNKVLSAIYWSPSSHGFEPYRVVTINKDSKLREQLKPLMWNQGVVTEADKLVFFVSLKREVFMSEEWVMRRALRRQHEVVGKTGEEAEKGAQAQADNVRNLHLKIDEPVGDDWAMKQAYIALGIGMAAATTLDIGTTPMEGMEKAKVESLFLENGIINSRERVAVAMAAGFVFDNTSYAHWGSEKRVRDEWDKKFTIVDK